ncbi:MAG: Hpt domain-containing protein [Polyangiaceae bacterium]
MGWLISPERRLSNLLKTDRDEAFYGSMDPEEATQVVDLSFAEDVAAGDHEFMETLLRTFLRNVASLRTELDGAVAAADGPRIRRVSHGLKGLFQTMGALPAAEAALSVEKSEAVTLVQLGPSLASLTDAMSRVELAVQCVVTERYSAAPRAELG